MGNHGQRLLALVRGRGQAAVIMNGMDGSVPSTRQEMFERTRSDLSELGFAVTELDLRHYFEGSGILPRNLDSFDLIWANGGNAFTLNMAMRQSGLVDVLKELLEADRVVYGGYSAGAVVAGNTLRGIELVDSADAAEAVPDGYRSEISFEGLGLVEYAIVPHYRSDHWESEKIEGVVRRYMAEDVPHRALRDGEVIVVDERGDEHLA